MQVFGHEVDSDGGLSRWISTPTPCSKRSWMKRTKIEVLPVDCSPRKTTLILLFTCANDDSDFFYSIFKNVYEIYPQKDYWEIRSSKERLQLHIHLWRELPAFDFLVFGLGQNEHIVAWCDPHFEFIVVLGRLYHLEMGVVELSAYCISYSCS